MPKKQDGMDSEWTNSARKGANQKMAYEAPQERAKLEVSYRKPHVEKGIADWTGKTIKSARVVHTGSDGLLTVEFTDGTKKEYRFNELAFWEAK